MKKKVIKPFTIEAYKAMTESEHVETNSGLPVRIICTDRDVEMYPVVALVRKDFGEILLEYSENGEETVGLFDEKSNLVIVYETTTRTGWVNVYRNGEPRLASVIHRTKAEALKFANTEDGYIDTVEITWGE